MHYALEWPIILGHLLAVAGMAAMANLTYLAI